MPFTLRYEGGLVRVLLTETITGADLAGLAVAAQEAEEGLSHMPDYLTDLSGATRLDMGFADVFALAQRRLERAFRNPFRSALVAGTPAQLGIARMYQTLNDHPQVTVRIFPDVSAAQEWLREPRDPAG